MEDFDYENQRLNRMTKLVFTNVHLSELRLAVQDTFELFYDILTDPIHSYSDLKRKLENVSEGRLSNIRSKYLAHDEAGYNQGNFTENEKNSVVKILLDFIGMMDKCTKTIVKTVETKQSEILVMEKKLELMEERIRKTDAVIQSQKDFYKEKQGENVALSSRNKQLLEDVMQKNKKISELEKLENIQTWELEKRKLLSESSSRIQELEIELEEARQSNAAYKKKIDALDASCKKLQLKDQLRTKRESALAPLNEETGTEGEGDVHKLSKQNFMQDKDIVYLEKQLYDLQKSCVALIGGIKCDFNQMTNKFIDKDNGSIDEQFLVLSRRIEKAYKGMAENNVEKLKEELPPHYRYIEDDKFKIKRVRRLSTPIVTANPKVLNNILDEKKPVLSPIPQERQSHSTTNGGATHVNGKPVAPNPVLIDPVSKKLHSINPLKYFPFMSREFILDQYEKFTEYDKNRDGTLDIDEMVEVVKRLGFKFNIHQLQEAMEEVDRDENHTLDFFEYMLIIDNIYRRNGKAELFKQGFVELKKKNMSKTCTIQ